MSNLYPDYVSVDFAKSTRERLARRRTVAAKPQPFGWRCRERIGADSGGGGGQKLHGDADQFGQVARAKLLLELRAGVDHRLVADVELFGDPPIGLALCQQRERLQ